MDSAHQSQSQTKNIIMEELPNLTIDEQVFKDIITYEFINNKKTNAAYTKRLIESLCFYIEQEEVEFWIGVIGFKFISPRDRIINCFQIMKTSYINEYNRYINIQNLTVHFNPLFTFKKPPFH